LITDDLAAYSYDITWSSAEEKEKCTNHSTEHNGHRQSTQSGRHTTNWGKAPTIAFD